MSTQINYLDHVLKATNGALFANLLIYSQLVGVSKQTAHNQLHLGTFPLRTVHIGRTVAVKAVDLANFLETGIRQSDPPPKRTGRGAPRKYSLAQRAVAAKEKSERSKRRAARASQEEGVSV